MRNLGQIVIVSEGQIKISALRRACTKLKLQAYIRGEPMRTILPEQPVGFEEIYRCANMRAKQGHRDFPNSFIIGVESGVIGIESEMSPIDVAFVVLITPDGTQIVTSSNGIAMPRECVDLASWRGFQNTTVGSVVAEQIGGDPKDPHSVVTNGRVSREDTLESAFLIAFRHLFRDPVWD